MTRAPAPARPAAQSWDRVNPTDAAAACFYAPNPRNSFLNNAASGGWTGYSFPRLEAPVGMFRWRKDLVGPALLGAVVCALVVGPVLGVVLLVAVLMVAVLLVAVCAGGARCELQRWSCCDGPASAAPLPWAAAAGPAPTHRPRRPALRPPRRCRTPAR